MKIDNLFPSKYLKSSDLMGREAKVVMERLEIDSIGEERRAVVYFKGKEKGLVLNKTNANTIKDMWGDDSDGWLGKEIILFPTRVDFKGERVDAIRVKFVQPPARRSAAKPAEPVSQVYDDRNPPPAEHIPAHHDMNDEIPF